MVYRGFPVPDAFADDHDIALLAVDPLGGNSLDRLAPKPDIRSMGVLLRIRRWRPGDLVGSAATGTRPEVPPTVGDGLRCATGPGHGP